MKQGGTTDVLMTGGNDGAPLDANTVEGTRDAALTGRPPSEKIHSDKAEETPPPEEAAVPPAGTADPPPEAATKPTPAEDDDGLSDKLLGATMKIEFNMGGVQRGTRGE